EPPGDGLGRPRPRAHSVPAGEGQRPRARPVQEGAVDGPAPDERGRRRHPRAARLAPVRRTRPGNPEIPPHPPPHGGRLDPEHPSAVRAGATRSAGAGRSAWGAWHTTPVYRG